jgi:hypothetical protein
MTPTLKTQRMLNTPTLVVALFLIITGTAQASSSVQAGFDLFQTNSAAFDFDTIPNPQTVIFQGNPFGFYDFGSGLVGVGSTDTIVQRMSLADLTAGGACGFNCDTIDIEIVALSLISIAPVNLGFGAGFEDLSITLNTSSPSFQSTMTIYDGGEGAPHGTFNSVLNFSFDVTGSIGGFYATIEKTFTSGPNDWRHSPNGNVIIDGVNRKLNGVDESEDFHLEGLALHDTGGGTHTVSSVPEPSTALLVGFGLVALAAGNRKSTTR